MLAKLTQSKQKSKLKIVVGLGNPGSQYIQTRHNVGFMFLDFLVGQLSHNSSGVKFASKSKLQAAVLRVSNFLLIKPLTFMNLSGQAVQKVLKYYKAKNQLENLYVAHDDLDIQFGQHKINLGKGPRGHNGLLSIYQALGTDQFWHVRIGIENREQPIPGEKYVLQKFTNQEQQQLTQQFVKIKQAILS